MTTSEKILSGGDLRSTGRANQAAAQVNNQQTFDELYREPYNTDRKVVMRAADVIRRIDTGF